MCAGLLLAGNLSLVCSSALGRKVHHDAHICCWAGKLVLLTGASALVGIRGRDKGGDRSSNHGMIGSD